MKYVFRKINSKKSIKHIVTLAADIWRQHFIPLIGVEQVEYMLAKFQSDEAIAKQIRDQNYEYFSIENDYDTLGYFSYFPTKDYLYISKFYLKQEARGRGIARSMLSFIEKKAVSLGLLNIQLNVFKGNRDTIEIYKKLGFEIIDAPQINIGNGFSLDDYVMKKELKSY